MFELYRRMIWRTCMHGFFPSWLYDILYRLRKHWGFGRPPAALDPSLPPGCWRNYTFTYKAPPDTRWQRFATYLLSTGWFSPYRFDPYVDYEDQD